MVEFNRKEIAIENINYKSSSSNSWRTIFIIFLILIIIGIFVLLFLFQQYQEEILEQKINLTNYSLQMGYNKGFEIGTNQGITLGKSQCKICPIYANNTNICPICENCESTNTTVMNIAVQQTSTGNIVLYNGTNIVSLPINALCQQLKNGTIPR